MKNAAAGIIPSSKLTLPIPGRDHLHGPIEAPAVLLEYGDYECPYCGRAHGLVQAIQRRLGNRLCFAFRNFPLTNSHPHAAHAAEAAEAAAVQGKFWEMHNLLFENQDALEDEDLGQYALALGLDAQRLLAEVLEGVHEARVREDFRSGAHGGVNGTPTFFINGLRYDGEVNLEGMLAALSEPAQTP